MALAVEKAAVVVICMSQKYKDSPNCRTGKFQLIIAPIGKREAILDLVVCHSVIPTVIPSPFNLSRTS